MGRKYKIVMGLAPMLVLYGWLIIGGMMNIVVESLGYIPNLGFRKFSLAAYRNILLMDGLLADLAFSIYVSILATTISIIFGVVIAYYLATTQWKVIKTIMTAILRLGMILPYLYMVFLVVLTLGRTGILSRILLFLNLIDTMEQMPSIIFSTWGIGIILTFIAKGIPFVTLFTVNVMSNINTTYKDMAKVLGCNRMNLFLRLYVPMSKDVIVWTSAVLLAFSFGSFEVPFILSSLRPTTMSVRLFSVYSSPSISMIPTTMAITVMMLTVGGLLVLVYTTILRKLIKGYRI